MNKLKKIFNPIAQVAIWAFIAIIYLGGGRINVAIYNGLLLLLFLIGFGLLLKFKEKLNHYKYVETRFRELQHLLYQISKEHDITKAIMNEHYKASLQQEIKEGKQSEELRIRIRNNSSS